MVDHEIGEVFQHDRVYVRVVPNKDWALCRGCFFRNGKNGCNRNWQVTGNCLGRFRNDGISVHFELVF